MEYGDSREIFLHRLESNISSEDHRGSREVQCVDMYNNWDSCDHGLISVWIYYSVQGFIYEKELGLYPN